MGVPIDVVIRVSVVATLASDRAREILMDDLHLVIGAGPLGVAVTRELRSRGRRVRVATRSGRVRVSDRIDVVACDASDPVQVIQVCQGATVIYHCAKPAYADQLQKSPPIMDAIVEGAAAAGARLVYGDNLYAYGPVSGPLTEDLPYSAVGPLGRTRAQLAATLMEAHRMGKVRAVIGRSSDFFGPLVVESAVGSRVFRPALRGGTAQFLGNLDVPHTYTFIGDFSRALVTLGERAEALGQVWHVPSAETVTTRRFTEIIYQEAGTPMRVSVPPRLLISAVAIVSPTVRALSEVLYQFEQPFIVDHGKYTRAFGGTVTPHRVAIQQTLEWFRQDAA